MQFRCAESCLSAGELTGCQWNVAADFFLLIFFCVLFSTFVEFEHFFLQNFFFNNFNILRCCVALEAAIYLEKK